MAFSGSGAGKGAIGGASAGAAFGPWGAAIGGVAGGVIGGFSGGSGGGGGTLNRHDFSIPGYAGMERDYSRLAGQYGQRQAPQIAGGYMEDSAFRGDQSALIRQLQAQAAGHGVGQRVVQMQAQDAANRGLQQQYGMAAGAAPGSGASAARSAALAGGQIQSAVGQQAAMGGLQAQLGATDQLGGVLSGARGQDLQRNQTNLQAMLTAQQANQGAMLQQSGMNDQAQLDALRQRQSLNFNSQQALAQYDALRSGHANAMIGQPTTSDRMLGAAGGAAQMYMASRGGGGGANYGASSGSAPASVTGQGGNGSGSTPWGTTRPGGADQTPWGTTR